MLDRIAAEGIGGFEDSRAGCGDACINEPLAVGPRHDGDIATGALEDAALAAQFVNVDGRFRSIVTDQIHDVAGLGERLSWREPPAGRGERSRYHGAQTESPPRHGVLVGGVHEISPYGWD